LRLTLTSTGVPLVWNDDWPSVHRLLALSKKLVENWDEKGGGLPASYSEKNGFAIDVCMTRTSGRTFRLLAQILFQSIFTNVPEWEPLRGAVVSAIDRYNEITYLTNKLVLLHGMYCRYRALNSPYCSHQVCFYSYPHEGGAPPYPNAGRKPIPYHLQYPFPARRSRDESHLLPRPQPPWNPRTVHDMFAGGLRFSSLGRPESSPRVCFPDVGRKHGG
jgi:hypothetical protein